MKNQIAANVGRELRIGALSCLIALAGPSLWAGPNATNASGTATTMTNRSFAMDDTHKLAIGDTVFLQVLEDEEEAKPLVVMDSGDLVVPYVGPFPVVGLTCKNLAATLKTELEKKYYYHATVIVAVDLMAKSRGKVYLNGAVQTPGPEEIPSDEILTVSKAILRAGGLTDLADGKHVKITRKRQPDQPETEPITVNVEDIQRRGKTDLDIPLEPDDRIFVPERFIHF